MSNNSSNTFTIIIIASAMTLACCSTERKDVFNHKDLTIYLNYSEEYIEEWMFFRVKYDIYFQNKLHSSNIIPLKFTDPPMGKIKLISLKPEHKNILILFHAEAASEAVIAINVNTLDASVVYPSDYLHKKTVLDTFLSKPQMDLFYNKLIKSTDPELEPHDREFINKFVRHSQSEKAEKGQEKAEKGQAEIP